MSYESWKRETEEALNRHIGDKAAVSCALALMSGAKVVHQIFKGEVDDAVKQGVADLYVQQTIMLPLNPFWQARGAHIAPVLTTAGLGWFDTMQYAAKAPDDTETRLKIMTLRSYNYEIATSILLAIKGGAALDGKTVALRDELAAIDTKYRM